jgi:alkylhydroperoxidase family enzyme
MARVPYLNREDVPEEYRAFYDTLAWPRGIVLNLHRSMLHAPGLMQKRAAYSTALNRDGRLPPQLRELAQLTIGVTSHCLYEYYEHVISARRLGVSDEKIMALPVYERHPVFTPEERAVIRYAEEMTANVRVSDETFNALREFFDDALIVELTMLIAHYNSTIRIAEALLLEVEEGQHDGGSRSGPASAPAPGDRAGVKQGEVPS